MSYDPLDPLPDTNLEVGNYTVDKFDALEDENAALRARVAELEAKAAARDTWATQAEAVRVAAEAYFNDTKEWAAKIPTLPMNWSTAELFQERLDREKRLRTAWWEAFSSCPPLESINREATQ